jgi:dienelactone hydrolase
MVRSLISAFIWVSLAATTAHAQYARDELHPIPAAAMSPEEFLTGKAGSPITLVGQLRLPKLGEKLPAVTLLHGAGGMFLGNAYDAWVPVLNEAGIATFAVDSFAGRRIVNIPADVGKVALMSRTIDAFRALAVLAKHPAIDPARIAVMGFSHGSLAAMLTNVERFQKMHGSPDVGFAAHISVYGFCATTFQGDDNTKKPLPMLHGASDDWLPAGQCRDYEARLTKAGKSVQMIEYAGAHHAYDMPAYKPERKIPQGVSPRNCTLAEGANGQLINVKTQQPFTPDDPCQEKGVTLAYQEAAAKKSHEDVKAFLKEHLKLR